MAPTPSVYTAFTAPINPPSATPVISIEQFWKGLQRKVAHAEEFVGAAIIKSDVVDTSTDKEGRKVITRHVLFREGNKKETEVCTFFEPTKVDFVMSDGSKVENIVSVGAGGDLYLTYAFEWLLPGISEEELKKKQVQYAKMAQGGVEHTIEVMREMVSDGRL